MALFIVVFFVLVAFAGFVCFVDLRAVFLLVLFADDFVCLLIFTCWLFVISVCLVCLILCVDCFGFSWVELCYVVL